MIEEIIVNYFKNPLQNIDINLEKSKFNNILIIKNNDDNDDNESSENEDNINKYYFNCLSKEKIDNKIEILILKNINIDISKSNIQFKSLKLLSLKNSTLIFPLKTEFCDLETLNEIKIKGDLKNVKMNLSNLKENNFLGNIKCITLKFFPKSSNVNLFKLLNSLNLYLQDIKSLNIYFKGILSNLDNKDKINNEIFSKIRKIFIFALNKLNIESCKILKEDLIDKLNNLQELYLNENIECNLSNKLKLFPIIDNCEDININFNLYDINKLSKINLSICEYNRNKNKLILYGEANMSFYNSNNKELLLNIINNNHKGKLMALSLCNFDLENISYLNDILQKSINIVDNLYIKNLNINQEFIDIIKSKNLFNCYKIALENIIFNEDEEENNFYEIINGYKLIKTLKLISLEDISKYKIILCNENLKSLYLEEIYDINYNFLKEVVVNNRKNKLDKISLKNLEVNEDEDKNDLIDIILGIRNNIKKLKLVGENFNFFYQAIQDKKIEFNCLQKLILNIDKENDDDKGNDLVSNDEDKIFFLERNKNLLNYKFIEKIDLQMLNITYKNKQKIFGIYNNLKEIL